ncbi:MAG: hypothetical protein NTU58_03935 [Candidatus Nealsonbacteria bacterium]|nr:hypothetical protein [Candidatus Nealsonbacteria bacterium]
MQKKQVGFFLFFLIIISVFPFLISNGVKAELTQPKTIEESKGFFEKAIKVIIEKIPAIIKGMWKNEILPIWQKMWGWVKNFWNNFFGEKLHNFWYSFLKPKINLLLDKIRALLGNTIEKEKPIIERELEKEKEEIRKDIPTSTKSYIEKFNELLK